METTTKPLSEKSEFLNTYKSDYYYLKSGGFEDGSTMLANHITYMCENKTDLRVLKIIWRHKYPDKFIYKRGNIKKRFQ